MQHDKEQLKSENARLRDQHHHLESYCELREESMTKLQLEKTTQEKRFRRFLEQKELQAEALRLQIKEREKTTDILSSKLQNSELVRADLEQEVTDVRSQSQQMVAELEERNREVEGDHTKRLQECRVDCKALEERCASLAQDKVHLSHQLEVGKQEYIYLQDNCKNFESELSLIRVTSTPLQPRGKSLREELEDTDELVRVDLEQEVTDVRSQLEESQQMVAELEERIREVEGKEGEHTKRLQEYRVDCKALEERCASLAQDKVSLSHQLEVVKDEVISLHDENKILESKLDVTKSKIATSTPLLLTKSLQEEMEHTDAIFERMQLELSTCPRQKLRPMRCSKCAAASSDKGLLQRKLVRVDQPHLHIASKASDVTEMQHDYEQLKSENVRLRDQVTDVRSQLEESQQMVAELEERNREVEGDHTKRMQECRVACEALEERCASLAQDKVHLSHQLEVGKQEYIYLQDNCKNFESELSLIRVTSTPLQPRGKSLREELEDTDALGFRRNEEAAMKAIKDLLAMGSPAPPRKLPPMRCRKCAAASSDKGLLQRQLVREDQPHLHIASKARSTSQNSSLCYRTFTLVLLLLFFVFLVLAVLASMMAILEEAHYCPEPCTSSFKGLIYHALYPYFAVSHDAIRPT